MIVFVFISRPAFSQIPEEFKNLQVLPKDIKKGELVQYMRGFAMGLGVRCQFCHVGEEGKPLDTFDFVTDVKATKKTARVMLRMVQAINNEHLAKLEGRSAGLIQVNCVTCHHGQSKPRLLEEVLREVIFKDGITAAIAEYHKLREKYYGGFAYDFSEKVLMSLAEGLSSTGKNDEALEILKLNVKFYPESAFTYFQMAEIHALRNEKALAVENYKKSLELFPNNPPAKKKLEALEKQ
jgi:tetratricopeptide (TPR) repeat protein